MNHRRVNDAMMKKEHTVVSITDHPQVRRELLERTFKEHGSALKRFLKARLANAEDREDIIQELFVKLANIEQLSERLSENTGNTRSYLLSILTNLIVDRQRRLSAQKHSQHNSYQQDTLATEYPTPETVVATGEQLDILMSILKRMQPKCRQAFILNRFKYKSYPEVAKIMGVSPASVQRYIATALESLRRGLR